jgi:hypothetical protein
VGKTPSVVGMVDSAHNNNYQDAIMIDGQSVITTVSTSSAHLLTACLLNHYLENEGYLPWHYDEIRAHGVTKQDGGILVLGWGPQRFLLKKEKYSR